MIGLIDKAIEKILKRALHKKRDAIFQKTLDDYITTHNPDEETIAAAVVTFDKEQLEILNDIGKEPYPADIEELQKIADDLLRKINELSQQTPRQSTHTPSDFDMPAVTTSGIGLWQSRQRCEENDNLVTAKPEIRPGC